ncbi:MAG: HSP90 family protein [Arachnia sp.]
MTHRFQVDLAGMVDLLSHHLYSGPQVYIRELLQNGVDAITARRSTDPAAPGRVRLVCGTDEAGRAWLEITDTGIGLTSDEAVELLATIGRSSKRDQDLGQARHEFIGQFGIGMLASFMVAEQIDVWSRTANSPAIHWSGRADGTFTIGDAERDEVGSLVRLVARPAMEHWLSHESVLSYALDYGSLLPIDLAIQVQLPDGSPRWRRLTQPELPWREQHPNRQERDYALGDYCVATFGFRPLGHIRLELPAAGVTGVAFILPQAVAPGSGRHRVYIKRMLLGDRVDRILPDWAFFVRAVIETDTLVPTASREQLHDDELLLAVREALSQRLITWLCETLAEPSQLASSFIRTHHLALRAAALHDNDVLDLVAKVLPFETTDGPITLAEAVRDGELLYAATTEVYRRTSAVARSQGLVVVNAGYVYDSDLISRLGAARGWRVRELSSDDVSQALGIVSVRREAEAAGALVQARAVLHDEDCDVLLRQFTPEDVPAVLLRDSDGEKHRDLERERSASPGLWGGLLDTVAGQGAPSHTRTLVLNDHTPVVRRLLAGAGHPVFGAGVRALYLSAVMLAGEGLRSHESANLSDALGVLLAEALSAPEQDQERS